MLNLTICGVHFSFYLLDLKHRKDVLRRNRHGKSEKLAKGTSERC